MATLFWLLKERIWLPAVKVLTSVSASYWMAIPPPLVSGLPLSFCVLGEGTVGVALLPNDNERP